MDLPPLAAPPSAPTRDDRLREAALQLEASFLKEMLEEAGLGRVPSAFGEGEGETPFASVLLDAQAQRLARAGGIGLAESLFEAMKARQGGAA